MNTLLQFWILQGTSKWSLRRSYWPNASVNDGINRGGHFLLTEAFTENASVNQLTEAVMCYMNASVNRGIFIGVYP